MKNQQITILKLNQIIPDPEQPRQEFDPFQMKRLKESIEQYGILNPLAVEKQKESGDYLLLDGERRWRTAKELELKEVPAIVYEPLDIRTRLTTRFHLQEQHTSWSMFDKANVVLRLREETGMSVKELASLLGISDTMVGQFLAINMLTKRARTLLNEKKVPFGFISRIGVLLKQCEPKDRAAVEQAMILKVQNRIILKEFEVSKYALAIKKGDEKVVKAIIQDPELSSNDVLNLAKVGGQLIYNHIIANASYLDSQSRKLTGGFNCVAADIKKLRNCAKSLTVLSDKVEKLTE